jgi:hypothetical protein
VFASATLAGDDQHDLGAVRLRPAQKPKQRAVRIALAVTVEIEARVDRIDPTREALLGAAFKRHERGRWRRSAPESWSVA